MKISVLYALAVLSLAEIIPVSNHDCMQVFQNAAFQQSYSKKQVEDFVREVFAEHADVLVFKSKSGRLELIMGFLNRFSINHAPEYSEKKFPLLSELALRNRHNPHLKRDIVFDPSVFNPLKYAFPMTSKERQAYRVDNTDYIITIKEYK